MYVFENPAFRYLWQIASNEHKPMCHLEGNGGPGYAKRSQAVAAWNRRVPMEKAREALADLIELARAAMKDANRDGGEYDVRGELEEAQSALAALDGK